MVRAFLLGWLPKDAMEKESDELRRFWSYERLKTYDRQWIAFYHGDVEDNDANFEALHRRMVERQINPIFAFVSFKVRA